MKDKLMPNIRYAWQKFGTVKYEYISRASDLFQMFSSCVANEYLK